MARLAVNIESIGYLRSLSGTDSPDPLSAAVYAEVGGADGIVCPVNENLSPVSSLREQGFFV